MVLIYFCFYLSLVKFFYYGSVLFCLCFFFISCFILKVFSLVCDFWFDFFCCSVCLCLLLLKHTPVFLLYLLVCLLFYLLCSCLFSSCCSTLFYIQVSEFFQVFCCDSAFLVKLRALYIFPATEPSPFESP